MSNASDFQDMFVGVIFAVVWTLQRLNKTKLFWNCQWGL